MNFEDYESAAVSTAMYPERGKLSGSGDNR